MQQAPLVMVCANQAWNLVNFRGSLIRALIGAGYRVMAVAPHDPMWSQRLRDMGCDCADMPMEAAGTSLWQEARLLARMVALMRRVRPAAFLGWTIKPNCYGALAARLCGVPAIPNVSGLGTAFIRRNLLTLVAGGLYRLAFARCPTVFFQNGDDRDLFLRLGLVRGDQVRLLPGSGIDLARFAVPPGGRPTGRRFVLIARLLADKGVREFVAAARMLRGVMPEARFVLVGQVGVANRTAIAQDELDGWLAEGVVEWQPPVEDIRPVIAGAEWVVLPSYREGLSRVLLEAAAMGRPIVTSDAPGCRDIVREGENGFLAPVADADGLAAALCRAGALDDAAWGAMAACGRARVEAEFAESRVIALYLQALCAAGVGAVASEMEAAGASAMAAFADAEVVVP
ncbi:glycosyltransferase [Novosphingobium sp. FSY-8]|uniref:Glycosyltransferase n=1 Tax=Novosphingobium ovatum TaxID=1908523 RepID=A0ABW9X8T9_9SPHN|nr:glycosyltransferase family 4 protein [Novosphingobium ovatum]NBC34946.1 glycosyltransferase [Novosphingobium ovatum]